MSQETFIVKNTFQGTQCLPATSLELEERIISITDAIEMESAIKFRKELHYLQKDSKEPIHVYISSGGGMVDAGMVIVDLMMGSSCPIYTYVVGEAASMAAIIFSCGEKGHRYMLPHSKVMIHEPLMRGVGGNTTALGKVVEGLFQTREMTSKLLAERTGKTLEEVLAAIDHDHYMDAKEAMEFGIADDIVNRL